MVIVRSSFLISSLLLLTGTFCSASAEVPDPLNPFEYQSGDLQQDKDPDQYKSAHELITEALELQRDDRPLDARTKLLKALHRDPHAFEAHMLLADYYLQQVGHFRLAMAYTKRALELFQTKVGPPPYSHPYAQLVHRDLLALLSSVRLNLDNYKGALEALDEYQSLGYYQPWLPAHRAWILMKLGRLEEAIRTARLGMLSGAEPGQTLNILGILLSMTDAKQAALEMLKQAISYEKSLGEKGRPATPLNNAGEVYKEIFEEDLAREAWQEAVRLPDGCEHVLPSLNLSMLYLEENDFVRAKQAIDSFEACLAQFPLRNGEEHRALVHMARGRIALHQGRIDQALEHLEAATQRQQWFGKIGTNQKDLRSAVLVSLAQALRRQNNHLRLLPPLALRDRLSTLKTRWLNSLRAWWLMRRAAQILAEDLDDFEDLYIRRTDSMLEYATLGELLTQFPSATLKQKLTRLEASDTRMPAQTYYQAYLAENLLKHGRRREATALLDQVLSKARPVHDAALHTHAQLLKLGLLSPSSTAYISLAYRIFRETRAELLNYGFRLPVNANTLPVSVRRALDRSAFQVLDSQDLPCRVHYHRQGREHELRISCDDSPMGLIEAKNPDEQGAANALAIALFKEG